MRILILVVVGFLLVATNTWAATYSVTLTPEQDTALTVIVAQANTERAALDARNLGADGNPVNPRLPLTVEQYVTRRFKDMLDNYVEQQKAMTQTTIKEAWEKADDATRAKVKTDLGLQ
jgi:hypothetical protein